MPTRRTVLKGGAASLATFSGVARLTAAQSSVPEVVQQVTIDIPDVPAGEALASTELAQIEASTPGLEQIDSDIAGLDKIDSIVVSKHETGSVSYGVSGTSPDINNGAGGFGIRSGIGPDSDSDQLAVEVVADPLIEESDDGVGGSAGDVDAANWSTSDVSTSADETKDDNGTDLVENYEGGVHARTGTNESAYPSDRAHHRQTHSWEASNGNVDSTDGEYCTTWTTYDSYQWNLEGNGWKEQDNSGDNYYSKSYSQLTKYDQGSDLRTQLQTDMTMKPDGTFDWWAEIHNEVSRWGTHFEMYSNYYDTNC